MAQAIDIMRGAGIEHVGLITAKIEGRAVTQALVFGDSSVPLLRGSVRPRCGIASTAVKESRMQRKSHVGFLIVAAIVARLLLRAATSFEARDLLNKGVEAYKVGVSSMWRSTTSSRRKNSIRHLRMRSFIWQPPMPASIFRVPLRGEYPQW